MTYGAIIVGTTTRRSNQLSYCHHRCMPQVLSGFGGLGKDGEMERIGTKWSGLGGNPQGIPELDSFTQREI